MTQQNRTITDAREIWANDMRHWLDIYKVSVRQGDEITENIALGKIELLSMQILKKGEIKMTHEIEVRVKVEGVAGEIIFCVSDMPRVESSVRKNLANFDNWLYAKWTENDTFHCIESAAFQAIS